MTRDQQNELRKIVISLFDGIVVPSDIAQLTQGLADDAETQAVYLELVDLDIDLEWSVGLRRSSELLSVTSQDASALPENAADPDYGNPTASQFSPFLPLQRKSAAFSWPLLRCVALVALCFYGSFVFVAWNSRYSRPNKNDSRVAKSASPPASMSVAEISAEKDCVWEVDSRSGSPFIGKRLDGDDTIRLRSGIAELVFADGAMVAIEGPCELKLRTMNKSYLSSGKLAAHVPPRAVGFEVETPTARVVDLGTDFRLEVGPQETKLAVIVGKVDLFPMSVAAGGSRQKLGSPRRVLAGEAVAIAARANGAAIVQDAKFDTQWLSVPAATLPQDRSVSSVVAYQLPENSAGNRMDFHGGVGLDFDVRVPIRVLSLGVFDHLGDGIDPGTSPIVQLWSRDTQDTPNDPTDDVGRSVIAFQTFRAGDSGEPKLGYRFKPLPKSIDLAVGSYSIVAYGLADRNPFITFGCADPDVDFSSDPGWTGSKNTKNGNHYGWSESTNHAGGKKGEVGGTFAQNQRESFYGDTSLSRTFTLNDSISAACVFSVFNTSMKDAKFFIGHYSSSTANDRREFIGAEFMKGDADGWTAVRARIFRFNGDAMSDAYSGYVNVSSTGGPFHFDYTYDPKYENDGNHAGPEGRLALNVYNDTGTLNSTVYAINDGSHRDAGSAFDSFGMGIGTMESIAGDDPDNTAELFMDHVTYSGFRASDSRANSVLESENLIVRKQIETWQGAIVPSGARLEMCKPGTFPTTFSAKKIDYRAGSFEFCPHREEAGSKR